MLLVSVIPLTALILLGFVTYESVQTVALGKEQLNALYLVQICHRAIVRFAQEFVKKVPNLSPEACRMLGSPHDPGNIRELKNIIERAMISCHG